jgi:hypothetical protein
MLGADREKGTPDGNEFATAQGSISARLSVLRRARVSFCYDLGGKDSGRACRSCSFLWHPRLAQALEQPLVVGHPFRIVGQ